MTLDFNSELKQNLRRYKYPSPNQLSAEEVVVMTAFLDGAKDPQLFLDEEYPDVFGQGLLGTEEIKVTLETLCSKGVLVSCESDGSVTGFQEPRTREIHATLQSIARITRKIADDVAGLGAYASQYFSGDEASLASEIEAVRNKMVGVFEGLKRLRGAYVERQLEKLEISSDTRGLRLNMGSGMLALPTPWINIDFSGKADLVMNVQWGLPFKEGSADYIYGAHFLEHIDYKVGVMRMLSDFYRVLSPGGRLRLVVPNIRGYISAYLAANDTFFEERSKHNPFLKFYLNCRLEHVLDYAGAGMRSRAGEFFEHKFGYDFDVLRTMLHKAGFQDVVESQYMKSSDPALQVDNVGTFSSIEFAGIPNSMFVEAVK